METSKLKNFALLARRSLIEQVSTKLELVLAEGSAARRESAKAIRKLETQMCHTGSHPKGTDLKTYEELGENK